MVKKNLLLMFGGESSEYEISLVSAYNVLKNLNSEKYDIITVGVTRNGEWKLFSGGREDILNDKWEGPEVFLVPGGELITVKNGSISRRKIDCVFPVMHGRKGEDGKLQGLFEICGVPYVGCGTFSSAVCMDKIATHIMLSANGIKNTRYMGFSRIDLVGNSLVSKVEKEFSYPVFVKPANTGSSIGISKATDRNILLEAVEEAFKYDSRILVEEAASGSELECAVLGNDNPVASGVGEIIPDGEFYDYNAKYNSDKNIMNIPAKIDPEIKNKVQELAKKAFTAMGCSGLARVDFFYDRETGELYLNELNTLPGFTEISMYSKLFGEAGTKYGELLDMLITLALERSGQ